MARFVVTPSIASFSCEHGIVTANEDGTFVIDDPNIYEAMIAHGMRLEEVADQEDPKPDSPKRRRGRTDTEAVLTQPTVETLEGSEA